MATTTDNSLLIAAVLEATDPDLAASLDARSSWKDSLSLQGARVALYRKYRAGEHRSGITDQMRKMLRIFLDGSGLDEFNDNYCEIVVSKMADRLSVNEIKTDTEEGTKWLSELLLQNNFESFQDGMFYSAIGDGDTFVSVDPDTSKWSIEPSYDGFDGIVGVFMDDYITPTWACKIWSESSTSQGEDEATVNNVIMKIVVYQKNNVSYWVGKPGTDEIKEDPSQQQPVNVDTGKGNEVIIIDDNVKSWAYGGIPFIRFVNRLDYSTGNGRSEIHPAVPLQDVLNRTVHSMVMASEFSAFSIIWSIGMEIEVEGITPGSVLNLVLKDKNGKILTELTEEAAAFLNACRVGQFAATPMDQYLNQIKDVAREISHITQTPIYGITTEGQISGEAMKQLEVGLLGKVQRFQRTNTEAIKRLVMITAGLQRTFVNASGSSAPEFSVVTVGWKPAELLDVDAKIASFVSLRKSSPGLFSDDFYIDKIGGLLNLSPEEVKKEKEQSKKNKVDSLTSAVGNTGQVPVVV